VTASSPDSILGPRVDVTYRPWREISRRRERGRQEAGVVRGESLSRTYPVRETAAAAARRDLERIVGDLEPRVAETAELLVTELVANSIRHSGLAPGASIELVVSLMAGVIHAEVWDHGAGFTPTAAGPGGEHGGFGLFLVSELADRWGVEPEGRVWFELELEEAG